MKDNVYYSRSLKILDCKILEDQDEAITWVEGLGVTGLSMEIDKRYRQDVFIIPVAYIPLLISLENDYILDVLLEKANLAKEYIHILDIEYQEERKEEERERERQFILWCERRNKKYALIGLYDMVCAYCGKNLSNDYSELDHVIPRSQGGVNDPENLVVSCEKCNQKKHRKTPEEANMPIRYGDCNLLRGGGL